MKRYFIVNEYFGSRVYDSKNKTEEYYNSEDTEKIRNKLHGNFIEIDHKRTNQLSSPLKISMNITKKCNLRCKQCFTESGICLENELNTKEIYSLFDQMREFGTFFICLGGGEPLTRPDLLDILEYGKNKQLAVSVVSNGLLLTKEYIFSEYAVVYCIAISTGTSPSFSIYIGLAFIFSLFLFKNSTNELNPPS